jgi:hypothetical protein
MNSRVVIHFCLELKAKGTCVTETLPLVGSLHWSRNLYIKLAQKFHLETEVNCTFLKQIINNEYSQGCQTFIGELW